MIISSTDIHGFIKGFVNTTAPVRLMGNMVDEDIAAYQLMTDIKETRTTNKMVEIDKEVEHLRHRVLTDPALSHQLQVFTLIVYVVILFIMSRVFSISFMKVLFIPWGVIVLTTGIVTILGSIYVNMLVNRKNLNDWRPAATNRLQESLAPGLVPFPTTNREKHSAGPPPEIEIPIMGH